MQHFGKILVGVGSDSNKMSHQWCSLYLHLFHCSVTAFHIVMNRINLFSFALYLLQHPSQVVMWQLLHQHEIHANRKRLSGWEQDLVRFQQMVRGN